MSKFVKGMLVKVRAAFIAAGIFAVAAAGASLASFDWSGELGVWAYPIGAVITWFAAYWKKEHPEVDEAA